MIKRQKHLVNLHKLLTTFPIVGLVGARQVGKTTLARLYVNSYKQQATIFDLENPEDLAKVQDPMLALKDLTGLVIIDEVQRLPELFTVLRVLADRPNSQTRFLILGSASPQLLRQGSESLAGRIIYYELPGLSLGEVSQKNSSQLWLRGGFPDSYLANSQGASLAWRKAFIRTFLERDIPQLGINVRSVTLRRFWTMLAHYHGQIWNASELGQSFGVADTTVRNYLDLLSGALVVRQLLPWYENISKRQIKSPKIYITDSGILHALLNLTSFSDLEAHPKVGASWEGFIIKELTQHLGAESDECFYWGTHSGAELDLLVVSGKQRRGFEIKRTTRPKLTPSMTITLKDLRLTKLEVIHAGETRFPLASRVVAIPAARLLNEVESLR